VLDTTTTLCEQKNTKSAAHAIIQIVFQDMHPMSTKTAQASSSKFPDSRIAFLRDIWKFIQEAQTYADEVT
jgi:hypothetical protein